MAAAAHGEQPCYSYQEWNDDPAYGRPITAWRRGLRSRRSPIGNYRIDRCPFLAVSRVSNGSGTADMLRQPTGGDKILIGNALAHIDRGIGISISNAFNELRPQRYP